MAQALNPRTLNIRVVDATRTVIDGAICSAVLFNVVRGTGHIPFISDGRVVWLSPVVGQTDAAGECNLQLLPNLCMANGWRYRVTITAEDLDESLIIFMPDENASLFDLVDRGDPPIPLTPDEFVSAALLAAIQADLARLTERVVLLEGSLVTLGTIEALIEQHRLISDAHHTPPAGVTLADVQQLIADHRANVNAHHIPPTPGASEARVGELIDAHRAVPNAHHAIPNSVDEARVDELIAQHTGIPNAHHIPGTGSADGVSDSLALAVTGDVLTVTIGRSDPLADLEATVQLPGGGGMPVDHNGYIGWSDDNVPGSAELLAGNSFDSDTAIIPARATNGFLIFARRQGWPAELHFHGNVRDVLGAFTQVADIELNGEAHAVGVSNAEQNAGILGTGNYTVTFG